jgi:hypothetical protein
MQRYEGIQRPFRRLIQLKREAARAACQQMRAAGMLQADDARIELLSRAIALTLTYSMNFDNLLSSREESDAQPIYDGVLQVAALVAPYLGEQQTAFMDAALAQAADPPQPETGHTAWTHPASPPACASAGRSHSRCSPHCRWCLPPHASGCCAGRSGCR